MTSITAKLAHQVRPNQKPLLPRSRAPPGSVPMWRPQGGHRDNKDCPDQLLSPPSSLKSPHDTTIPISLARCLSPVAAVVRPSSPQSAARFQPRLKLSPRPHANYHQTNPASCLASSTTRSRSLPL